MNKYIDALERIASIDLDKVLEYLDYEKASEISCYGMNDYPCIEMSGDIATLLNLVEKATPKKPKIEKHPYSIDYESSLVDKYFCPNCNQFLREVAGYHLNKNYCDKCGQALDWSEE